MQEHIEDTTAGIYRITASGDIYSQSKLKIPIVGKDMEFTGKFKHILKPERRLTYTLNNRGYYSVGILRKTHMVHRLIAKAFLKNPENKPFVNHKDGNKLNNCLSNLEWCTAAENLAHARTTGLNSKHKGYVEYASEASRKASWANLKNKSKLTDDEVRYVRSVCKPRDPQYSMTALAKQFGVSVAAMCKIVKKETYSHIL